LGKHQDLSVNREDSGEPFRCARLISAACQLADLLGLTRLNSNDSLLRSRRSQSIDKSVQTPADSTNCQIKTLKAVGSWRSTVQ
jgi:hypothetical protein